MLSKLIEEFSAASASKQALLVAAGVGTVAATAVGAYYVKKRIDNTPPKQWRRAGEINEIFVYPIKSCGPIKVSRIGCSMLGPQRQMLRDRIFMVTNEDGKFVTARQKPKMVLIRPQFDASFARMTLSAPGMDDITIDVKALLDGPQANGVVWGETVPTVDCGDDVARWFSTYILGTDKGYRLKFYPLNETSRKRSNEDTGSLQDETSYMLFNTATVEDLNTRLDQKVTALQFRPNFVVKGPPAYAEDNWRWVKIGNTVFRYVKPCLRCVFTNIDPAKGISNQEGQPLKTLKGYRKIPALGESPAFGIHLGLRKAGEVSLGDPVYYGC
ncbi:mitochondrial amidoxime reducing component 2-like [Culex pipiens pallens]|uniref:mitochondrial amidoxime reducing component 2-like n=1 Tax=Culex pipiens pallens TaxID=42434 RepID=UPI001953A003|nr:mitochondrial amidoxime reducing component 2-like [Culex pipiens pallens]